ncbi:hypothetical protein V1511DRAFT_471676 [Dipodascopsis uninucleata]
MIRRSNRLLKSSGNATLNLRILTTQHFYIGRRYSDFMKPKPGPPRLPQNEQDEFENLVKKANESAFKLDDSEIVAQSSSGSNSKLSSAEMYHPDYRGRTIPEFEGDVNPKTGEIGGPKQDPLRHGDYSFNGRVTDF